MLNRIIKLNFCPRIGGVKLLLNYIDELLSSKILLLNFLKGFATNSGFYADFGFRTEFAIACIMHIVYYLEVDINIYLIYRY